MGVRVLLLALLCILVQSQEVSHKDVDCGWHGMTEEDCINKGCVWLAGFPGPWCQFPDSPYIPSMFDFGFDKITTDQYEIMQITALCFCVLSVLLFLGERKTAVNLDYIIVGIFFVLAWITRYHHIDHPKEVVFDEYYFGAFANSYCNRIYVFDIHPPLAKLTHYFIGSLLGVKCTMDFHAKDEFVKYSEYAQYVPYRLISAFFGTIVIPLAYLVGREFSFSVQSSVILATIVMCDSLLLSETRLILTDSQLFFYVVLSIYCALKLWNSKDGSFSRNFWTVATAVAAGCAFCVKFTALATLAWIGFATYIAVFTHQKPIGLIRCLIASVIAAVVFAIPFYFHIALGKRSGESDWNVDIDHQKLLLGNANFDSRATAPYFPVHLFYLIKRMLEQNAASLGDHPYASFWYEWIIGKGALLSYAEHREEEDWHGHIFIVSNVFICFTILAAFLGFIPIAFTLLRGRVSFRLSARETRFLKIGFLLFLGWIANLVPYALVERTTYSYHYLPGQFYGMLMIGLMFDEIPYFALSLFVKKENLERKLRLLRALFGILFLGGLFWNFFYYSCFSYGFGLDNLEYSKRKWIVGGV